MEPVVEAPASDEGLAIDLTSRPVWVVAIARAGSGKTVLTRSIFYTAAQQGVYKHIICFTQTGKSLNNEYDWLPDHAVREVHDVEQIFAIFDKLKKWKERNPKKKIQSWALLLEDLYGEASSKLVYHPKWTHICACFRHYNCSVFYNVQYFTACSPHMRSAIDYMAVFRTRSKKAVNGIYSVCDAHFDNIKDFKATLQEATKEQYHCMWYDARAEDRESAFRSFKATPPPSFKINFKPTGL